MAERAHAQDKSSQAQDASLPKQGETYRCNVCGMELQITSDCHCQEADGPHLECCGKELARA
jgi:hypothetical protein